MKIVKLTDKKLNEIIQKVIKEQSEEQISTTGPSPEEVTGSPEDEGGEPDYEGFLNSAKALLGQGITIGTLVDKLLDAQAPEEPEVEPTEPEMDSAIPSDNQ